jgi:hypothetical protein
VAKVRLDTGYCYFFDSFGFDLILVPFFFFFLPIPLSTIISMLPYSLIFLCVSKLELQRMRDQLPLWLKW